MSKRPALPVESVDAMLDHLQSAIDEIRAVVKSDEEKPWDERKTSGTASSVRRTSRAASPEPRGESWSSRRKRLTLDAEKLLSGIEPRAKPLRSSSK